eukprot:c7443_g1_i3.p1 GENE.c7443_g1_i3~~c7443_g1_i3.p1  ORF type:complete len:122 (-),score=18.13 c7443_g1_i3:246-611(-)
MNEPSRFELFLIPEGKSKVQFIPDTKIPNAGTFLIEREDHTLGNLLRMQLLNNPAVLFSGYRMPHPLEHKIELRIQTVPETDPKTVLLLALRQIKEQVQYLQEKVRDDTDRLRVSSSRDIY